MKIKDIAKRASRLFRRRPKPISNQAVASEDFMDANRRSFLAPSFAAAMAAAAAGAGAFGPGDARADTLFTNFAFPASGSGQVNRTMPVRLAEVKNVKDFGAAGTGVVDDLLPVQAAVTAAAEMGYDDGTNRKGGVVLFPTGKYFVSAKITYFQGAARSISLVGQGAFSTSIRGSHAGFVIDSSETGDPGPIEINPNQHIGGERNFERIIGLNITNSSTADGSGAIRWVGQERGTIADCVIGGRICVLAAENNYNSKIISCTFNPATSFQGVGIIAGQQGIHDCSFAGLGTGIYMSNVGGVVTGCRFEVCIHGILIGYTDDGSGLDAETFSSQAAGFSVSGNSFERCRTALWLLGGSGGSIFGNNVIGLQDPQVGGTGEYGFRIGFASGCSIKDNVVNMSVSIARMDFSAASGGPIVVENNAVGGVGAGVHWAMPVGEDKKAVHFGPGNTYLPYSNQMLYSELPTNVDAMWVEGIEYLITDGVSSGGSSATSTASSITGTTLTVGGTVAGIYRVGDHIVGTGVTANTIINACGTGTGGAGTYTVNNSQTVGSTAIDGVGLGCVITDGGGGIRCKVRLAWGPDAWRKVAS